MYNLMYGKTEYPGQLDFGAPYNLFFRHLPLACRRHLRRRYTSVCLKLYFSFNIFFFYVINTYFFISQLFYLMHLVETCSINFSSFLSRIFKPHFKRPIHTVNVFLKRDHLNRVARYQGH